MNNKIINFRKSHQCCLYCKYADAGCFGAIPRDDSIWVCKLSMHGILFKSLQGKFCKWFEVDENRI